MTATIHPTLTAAAHTLIDQLAAHTAEPADTWARLWQPPLPDSLVASEPQMLPGDPADGTFTVTAGHAYWAASSSQPALVWVTRTEPRRNGEVLRVEAIGFRGRIETVPIAIPDALNQWAGTIPHPDL